MKRLLYIALILVSSSSVLGQGQSYIEIAIEEKPLDCKGFTELVESRDFQAANAMLIGHSERPCEDSKFYIAMARLKAAEFDFEAAERILEDQVNAHPEDMELQKEWNHMVRLLDYTGEFEPINVWPSSFGSTQNDIMIAWMNDTVPQLLKRYEGQATHFPIRKKGSEQMLFDEEGVSSQLEEIQEKLQLNRYEEIGPGTYLHDGSLLITAVRRVPYKSEVDAEELDIVLFDQNGHYIGPLFDKRKRSGHHAFPVYNPVDTSLIFSSDMPGTNGGMDLWRSQFRDGEWTVPENLGPKVNSPYNEILATISGDTLYYSSDRPYTGYGGYDIYGYHFSERRNWNLGIPLNGPYDEHSFHVLDPGRGMLVSNRFGEFSGGVLYTTTWSVKEDFFDEISGHISGSGDLSGEEVIMLNQEGAVIQRGVINTDGSFVFRHVKGMETYTIQLADKKLHSAANLKVFDGDGKLLQEVSSSGEQGFKFVLLNPIEYIMERVDNEDQSILSVSIIGKLDENEPEVQGLTIVLLDGEGTEIAKTKTGADGLFRFESVAADEKYHIVSEVKDAGKPIYILDAQGNRLQTILPNGEGEYAYVRIKPEDGVITLSNEYNKRVRISDKDLFNLGAVQYELNSYTIAKESAGVLDKLVAILNANPEIALHLSGHTDSRGADDFNLKLSQKRLNSAIAYLKHKGVDPSRLSGIGYGETKLLNHCDDDADCSEEEHAANRRTEFRLKEMGK